MASGPFVSRFPAPSSGMPIPAAPHPQAPALVDSGLEAESLCPLSPGRAHELKCWWALCAPKPAPLPSAQDRGGGLPSPFTRSWSGHLGPLHSKSSFFDHPGAQGRLTGHPCSRPRHGAGCPASLVQVGDRSGRWERGARCSPCSQSCAAVTASTPQPHPGPGNSLLPVSADLPVLEFREPASDVICPLVTGFFH